MSRPVDISIKCPKCGLTSWMGGDGEWTPKFCMRCSAEIAEAFDRLFPGQTPEQISLKQKAYEGQVTESH